MLLTAREVEERRKQAPREKIAALVAEEPPARVRKVVRMFHPDSTVRCPITCDFQLSGETIHIKRGVAEVPDDLAPLLLRQGWRQGKTLEKEWRSNA
jgi:hypothetical protein